MSKLAVVYTRAMMGMHAPLVTVEAHLSLGMPGFSIVGLPEAAVRESRDRVRSALLNSNFSFPDKRITINLAPADIPKGGSRFDLPIALGIIAASGQLPLDALHEYEFTGELALSGEVRSVLGTLPFAIKTRQVGRKLIVPESNAHEAALAGDLEVYPAKHLLDVCAHLRGEKLLLQRNASVATINSELDHDVDLADVRGQQYAKRALEIAAAGGHSLLMMGPPGTGKTMLASRLPSILPPLTEDESLEVAAVRSISKQLNATPMLWRERPFRAPHHTASSIALVGGGRPPCPGEISLAHRGVLFLDELPEFNRQALETLREPLESGTVTISRAGNYAEFPANFQLIAAMNPCPCGHVGDAQQSCRCTPDQIQRYRARLSGPLLDRIDLHVTVPPLLQNELPSNSTVTAETSAEVRARVEVARDRQMQRANKLNFQLNTHDLNKHCQLNSACTQVLEQAINKFKLSARAYHRILRVARTIADLAKAEQPELPHISEALSYRQQAEQW